MENGKVEAPKPLKQDGAEFLKDAEWCMLRGAQNSAVIAKGGNNGESHNHNDVGSFYYLVDGEAFLDDLGAGEYTKDYFSEKRYEIFCNRGKSHNIPIIGCVDQKDGNEYRADQFELKEDHSIFISFAKAYGIEAQKVYREIWLDEQSGALTVCDYIQCRPGVSVYENLITRFPVSIEADGVVIHGEKHSVKLEVEDHEGELEQIHVIRWEIDCDEPQNSKTGIADCKICLHILE